MSLLAHAAAFDRQAFALLNGAWTNPFLDTVMPVVTNIHKYPWFAYGIAPAALGAWLYKGGRRAVRVLVVAALAAGVCDAVAYRVIKPWAGRPRPEYAGIGAIVRGPSGGRLGFPSNHATNASAVAATLSVAYPAATPAFWAAALFVAYSRVYVGAHYPLDVLAGLALGGALAWPWAVLMLGGGAGAKPKKKKR